MKKLLLVLVVIGLAVSASFAKTNDVDVSSAGVERILEYLDPPREGFVRGDTRQVLILTERRLELSLRNQTFRSMGYIDLSTEKVNGKIQSLSLRSFEYGLQDYASKIPTIQKLDVWLSMLILGALDANEESVDPLGGTYQETRGPYLETVRKSSIMYGIKPRTSPYAFVSFKISENGVTLGYVHARYYMLDDLSFDQKVEVLTSVPITKRLSFSVGVAYSPDRYSKNVDRCVGVVRADYQLLKKYDVHGTLSFRPGADRFAQFGVAKLF